jgi:hypothetical protein
MISIGVETMHAALQIGELDVIIHTVKNSRRHITLIIKRDQCCALALGHTGVYALRCIVPQR